MHNLVVDEPAERLREEPLYAKEGGRERYFATEEVSRCTEDRTISN